MQRLTKQQIQSAPRTSLIGALREGGLFKSHMTGKSYEIVDLSGLTEKPRALLVDQIHDDGRDWSKLTAAELFAIAEGRETDVTNADRYSFRACRASVDLTEYRQSFPDQYLLYVARTGQTDPADKNEGVVVDTRRLPTKTKKLITDARAASRINRANRKPEAVAA